MGAAHSGRLLPAEGEPADGTGATTTTVFAGVDWNGLCDDPAALERAVRERGARLQSPRQGTQASATEQFTVNVNVQSASDGHGYAAQISISSARGARDARELTASRCAELHSAIAWVLVVLARRPRSLDENHRESVAKTDTGNRPSTAGPVPATVKLPAAPRVDTASTASLDVHGHVTVKAQPRFALGAQLIGGWSYLRDPAWGPAVFFEHRPWRDRAFGLRLSLLTLANDTSGTGSDVEIAARRTAVGLSGWLQVPGAPVTLSGGLEAGVLSARGSGALVSHQSRRAWGAGVVGLSLELPLFGDRLWLAASAHIAICPFTYAFRTTSERTVVESGPIEPRAAAGLKSRF